MLISKTVKQKWNSKTKSHYVNLGYSYTKMGEEFEVNVSDLTHGSHAEVQLKCDYCNCIFNRRYYLYIKIKEQGIDKDCCNDQKCICKKIEESFQAKYGVKNVMQLDFVIEKAKKTNLKRYGCENPFGNKEIQNKIYQTNFKKFGCKIPAQNKDIYDKIKNTCYIKYGVTNYGKLYSESHKGDKSPTWKPNVTHGRTERKSLEYRTWRKAVYDRDKYTCQCCGDKNKNGNGYTVVLNAHHIYNYSEHKDIRLDVNNGITLCKKCHIQFHSIYGKCNNNKQQLDEFINKQTLDKNIC